MKIAFPGRQKLRIERKTKILYIKEVKSKKTCSWQAEGEWDEDRKMGAGFSRPIGCSGFAGRKRHFIAIADAVFIRSYGTYDKMYMDINLPESSIRYVKEAQPVYVTHYTIPGDTLKARVGELSPAISTETRTFKGKILIDNDQLKLRPGMFAKADIIVDRADSSIIIPKDVILSNRRRKYVYIVEKNTAKIRNLQTGLEDEYNIEILSGLNVNDNLVVKGFETLKEDAKVKIQK